MQLILDTKGIVIRQRNGCFHLQTEKHERLIGTQKISSILITTHCVLTTAAIRLAIKSGIPIYFIDGFGRVEARLWSASLGHLSTIRRNQVLFALDLKATTWAINLFQLKIDQQLGILNWLKNRKTALDDFITENCQFMMEQSLQMERYKSEPLNQVSDTMMGLEGTAARCYWQCLSKCLPIEFQFEDRNRHPANDAFNASINYLYGMLYTYVETAIFSVGLDPYLGILHADQYNKPTLSYDIIEPFRVWADKIVMESFLNNEIHNDFFEKKEDAVFLGKKGKLFLIPRFNTFMNEVGEFRNTKTIRKNHIYRFAGELVDLLKDYR